MKSAFDLIQFFGATWNDTVTFLCLFLTVVVLRGTIEAGKFGTSEQDFNELRDHLYSRGRHVEPHRVLEEAQLETESDNQSNNYATFNITKILVDDEPEEKPNSNKPYFLGPKISE